MRYFRHRLFFSPLFPHHPVTPADNLQEKLDSVRTGGTVLLEPGVYQGPVSIDREVYIFARRLATVESRSSVEDAVTVSCPSGCVDGLMVRFACASAAAVTALEAGKEPCGVRVTEGKVRLQGLDISGAPYAGILVEGPLAEPSVSKCVVRGGHRSGIVVRAKGRGTFDACVVKSGHPLAGFEALGEGSDPVTSNVRLKDGSGIGFFVRGNARGRYSGCTAEGHALAGIQVSAGFLSNRFRSRVSAVLPRPDVTPGPFSPFPLACDLA